jgi:cytochrome c-type biogenesis protein CcsB
MGVGFVLHTAAIIIRSTSLGHLPVTNLYEYMSLFAWFAAGGYFVVLLMYRAHVLGAFVGPMIFMLIVSASLLPKNASMQLVPALQSYWLKIHVSLAALGEAAFTVSFAANIMYFVKSALPESSPFAKRLPDLDTLDTVAYKAITVGYPLFTVGALFAGAIWAHEAWGRFWSWDPKETSSLVVWLMYTAYLHARLVRDWRGMGAAVLSAIAYVGTILTIFSTMILGGLHAYG